MLINSVILRDEKMLYFWNNLVIMRITRKEAAGKGYENGCFGCACDMQLKGRILW